MKCIHFSSQYEPLTTNQQNKSCVIFPVGYFILNIHPPLNLRTPVRAFCLTFSFKLLSALTNLSNRLISKTPLHNCMNTKTQRVSSLSPSAVLTLCPMLDPGAGYFGGQAQNEFPPPGERTSCFLISPQQWWYGSTGATTQTSPHWRIHVQEEVHMGKGDKNIIC